MSTLVEPKTMTIEYPSDELAAMANARNYYHWIIGLCRTHLRRVVLEHDAEIGAFSAFLAAEAIDRSSPRAGDDSRPHP